MTTTGPGGESPIEIVELARRNQVFRREVVTGDHSQVVVMMAVPAGTRHNVRAGGERPLQLVAVYAPPEHPPGPVHQTKQEADAAEGH